MIKLQLGVVQDPNVIAAFQELHNAETSIDVSVAAVLIDIASQLELFRTDLENYRIELLKELSGGKLIDQLDAEGKPTGQQNYDLTPESLQKFNQLFTERCQTEIELINVDKIPYTDLKGVHVPFWAIQALLGVIILGPSHLAEKTDPTLKLVKTDDSEKE